MLTIVAAGVVYAAVPSRVTYLEEEGKPIATAVARAKAKHANPAKTEKNSSSGAKPQLKEVNRSGDG